MSKFGENIFLKKKISFEGLLTSLGNNIKIKLYLKKNISNTITNFMASTATLFISILLGISLFKHFNWAELFCGLFLIPVVFFLFGTLTYTIVDSKKLSGMFTNKKMKQLDNDNISLSHQFIQSLNNNDSKEQFLSYLSSLKNNGLSSSMTNKDIEDFTISFVIALNNNNIDKAIEILLDNATVFQTMIEEINSTLEKNNAINVFLQVDNNKSIDIIEEKVQLHSHAIGSSKIDYKKVV